MEQTQFRPRSGFVAKMQQGQYGSSSKSMMTNMEQAQFKPASRYQGGTMTNMEQSQFKPASSYQAITMTDMEQAQFRPRYLTRMVQNQFKNSVDEDDDADTKSFMRQNQFRN